MNERRNEWAHLPRAIKHRSERLTQYSAEGNTANLSLTQPVPSGQSCWWQLQESPKPVLPNICVFWLVRVCFYIQGTSLFLVVQLPGILPSLFWTGPVAFWAIGLGIESSPSPLAFPETRTDLIDLNPTPAGPPSLPSKSCKLYFPNKPKWLPFFWVHEFKSYLFNFTFEVQPLSWALRVISLGRN